MTAGTNLNVQAYNISPRPPTSMSSTAGFGIKVAEGSGAKQGIGTLASGALVVCQQQRDLELPGSS